MACASDRGDRPGADRREQLRRPPGGPPIPPPGDHHAHPGRRPFQAATAARRRRSRSEALTLPMLSSRTGESHTAPGARATATTGAGVVPAGPAAAASPLGPPSRSEARRGRPGRDRPRPRRRGPRVEGRGAHLPSAPADLAPRERAPFLRRTRARETRSGQTWRSRDGARAPSRPSRRDGSRTGSLREHRWAGVARPRARARSRPPRPGRRPAAFVHPGETGATAPRPPRARSRARVHRVAGARAVDVGGDVAPRRADPEVEARRLRGGHGRHVLEGDALRGPGEQRRAHRERGEGAGGVHVSHRPIVAASPAGVIRVLAVACCGFPAHRPSGGPWRPVSAPRPSTGCPISEAGAVSSSFPRHKPMCASARSGGGPRASTTGSGDDASPVDERLPRHLDVGVERTAARVPRGPPSTYGTEVAIHGARGRSLRSRGVGCA